MHLAVAAFAALARPKALMVPETWIRAVSSRRIPIDKTEERKLDFGFSEEQEMLRDAAKRFLADNCPTKFVRQMMADATAHDAGFWKKLVDLGWPGLLIPESTAARAAASST